jgi:hypothetical protein
MIIVYSGDLLSIPKLAPIEEIGGKQNASG